MSASLPFIFYMAASLAVHYAAVLTLIAKIYTSIYIKIDMPRQIENL
jgi:hypothetical protein